MLSIGKDTDCQRNINEKRGSTRHKQPVNERIKEYLTDELLQKVKGSYQIGIFHAARSIIKQSPARNEQT
jgi:hypothetical protein